MTDQPTLTDLILAAVADRTGVDTAALTRWGGGGRKSPRNRGHIAARRVAMIVLHRHAGRSLCEVAEITGHTTHTAVLDGIRAAESGANDKHLPAPAADLARAIAVDLGIIRAEEAA